MQLNIFNSADSLFGNQLEYNPGFFTEPQSSHFMAALIKNIRWKQETLIIFGKSVKTPRLTAWYGDTGVAYKYSGKQFFALPWIDELAEIKEKTEHFADVKFNSVLLNYYRDGNDSMGWHSDDEPELGLNPIIASVNFGQERRFDFRNKNDHAKKHHIFLGNGSLLIMKGDLQHHWQHQIAKSKQPKAGRINLTFRLIK